MSEVEIVDPNGPDEPDEVSAGPGDAPRYDPDRTRFVAAAVLWVAAAALCVVAAYQKVYLIGYGTGASALGNNLDAWGTYTGVNTVTRAIYGPQFAHVLVVLTVLFALLAGAAVTRVLSKAAKPFDSAVSAAGVGVTGVLLGLVVAIYLYVTSELDGVRAKVTADASVGDPVRTDLTTTVGHCAYFAVAALICAALAIFAARPPHRDAAGSS